MSSSLLQEDELSVVESSHIFEIFLVMNVRKILKDERDTSVTFFCRRLIGLHKAARFGLSLSSPATLYCRV